MGWSSLTAAPHRLMFFGGVCQFIAVFAFWTVELAGRQFGWWASMPTAIPATWAHAFLAVYAMFLFFIFGFLMTTYPRWMAAAELPRTCYVQTALLLAAGVLLFYAGLAAGRALLGVGVLLLLAGWARGFAGLLAVYRSAPKANRYYERWLNLAHIAGWSGAALFFAFLVVPDVRLLQWSLRVGLWLFLVPLFVTVAHRMLPFFSQNVIRQYRRIQPKWSLPVLWAGLAVHALLEGLGLIGWTWLVDLPLAGVVLWHSHAWQLRRSFGVRLLAVLHVAFAMLGVSLAAFALRSIWLMLTGSDRLGLAPQHLLAVGFLGAMVVAMATRVTLGHSGRQLAMDAYDWACFWCMIAAALLRALAELAPLGAAGLLSLAAALAWLLGTLAWGARLLPIYLGPRSDGKPG